MLFSVHAFGLTHNHLNWVHQKLHRYKKVCLSCQIVFKLTFHYVSKNASHSEGRINGLDFLEQDGKEIKEMLFATVLPKKPWQTIPLSIQDFLGRTLPIHTQLKLSSLKKIHEIGTLNLSSPWMAKQWASSSNAKMRYTPSKTVCSRKDLILTLMINQPILWRNVL